MNAIRPPRVLTDTELHQEPDLSHATTKTRTGPIVDFPLVGLNVRISKIREVKDNVSGELVVLIDDRHLYGPSRCTFTDSKSLASFANSMKAEATGVLDGASWRKVASIVAGEAIGFVRRSVEAVVAEPAYDAQVEMLVERFLPAGDSVILFGPRSSGKGYFTLYIALAVATGRNLLPNGLRIVTSVPVLYIDGEHTYKAFQRRLGDVMRGAGVDSHGGRIHYLRLYGSLVEHIEYIANYVASHGIGLVIVDSMVVLGSEDNERSPSKGVTDMVRALSSLGTTNLMISHPSKSEMRRERGPSFAYGSSYGENLARASWEIRASESDAPDALTFSISTGKPANDLPRYAPVGFRLSGFGAHRVILSEALLRGSDLSERLALWERIRMALEETPLRKSLVTDLAEALGAKVEDVSKELNRHKGVFVDLSVGSKRGQAKEWGLRYPSEGGNGQRTPLRQPCLSVAGTTQSPSKIQTAKGQNNGQATDKPGLSVGGKIGVAGPAILLPGNQRFE